MPDGIDSRLDHGNLATRMQDVAVLDETPRFNGIAYLRQRESRARDGNGRAHIESAGDLFREILGNAMAPGIERDDALRLAPLRMWADVDHRMCLAQVGARDGIERPGRHRERAINRIGA